MLIAEGTNLSEMSKVDQMIQPGQAFEVQLVSREQISQVQLDKIGDDLASGGVYPLGLYAEGSTVHIQLQKSREEGIGAVQALVLIPALIVGAVLLFYGWKIITMNPWDFFIKSLPWILLVGGAAFIIWQAMKSEEVRKGTGEVIGHAARTAVTRGA